MLIQTARQRSNAYSALFSLWFENVPTEQSVLFLLPLVQVIINYHFEHCKDILEDISISSALKGNVISTWSSCMLKGWCKVHLRANVYMAWIGINKMGGDHDVEATLMVMQV